MNSTDSPKRSLRIHIWRTVMGALTNIGLLFATLALILYAIVILAAITSPATLQDRRIFQVINLNVGGAILSLLLLWGGTNYHFLHFLGWRRFLKYLLLSARHKFWEMAVNGFSGLRKIIPAIRSHRMYQLELGAWKRRIALYRQIFQILRSYFEMLVEGNEEVLAILEETASEIDAIDREQEEMRAQLAVGKPANLEDRIRNLLEILRSIKSRFGMPMFH